MPARPAEWEETMLTREELCKRAGDVYERAMKFVIGTGCEHWLEIAQRALDCQAQLLRDVEHAPAKGQQGK